MKHSKGVKEVFAWSRIKCCVVRYFYFLICVQRVQDTPFPSPSSFKEENLNTITSNIAAALIKNKSMQFDITFSTGCWNYCDFSFETFRFFLSGLSLFPSFSWSPFFSWFSLIPSSCCFLLSSASLFSFLSALFFSSSSSLAFLC